MNSWLVSGLVLSCAVLAGEPENKSGDSYPPATGTRHPNLVLPSIQDGTALASSGFTGQRVLLLHFSTADQDCRDAIVAWNEHAKSLIEDHRLAVVGICHDKSPAYARLFMQWKQIDWPVAHDLLNHNGVEKLPLAIYLSEKGNVKQIDPEPAKLAKKLGKAKPLKPKEIPEEDREQLPDPKVTRRAAGEGRTAEAQCAHGEALILAGQPVQIDEAITFYTDASKLEPSNATAWFGLGVAHHIRHEKGSSADSAAGDDLKAAANAWKKVTELAGDNEVFKIEIRQFKAKPADMDKMFGWVEEAKKEIVDRGEKPVEVP